LDYILEHHLYQEGEQEGEGTTGQVIG
jgi:hypothetical protein